MEKGDPHENSRSDWEYVQLLPKYNSEIDTEKQRTPISKAY